MLHQLTAAAHGNTLRSNGLIKALQSEVKCARVKIQGSLPVVHAHIPAEVGRSQPQPVLSKPSGKVSSYSVPGGTEQGKKGEQIIC